MSSKKSRVRKQESSDSDSGPEDRNPPQNKKAKADSKSTSDADEDKMFQLGRMRYVTVREFRGKVLVDIREHYESDGDLKPGKKGICLTVDQWSSLKNHVDSIDKAIKRF